MQEELEYCFAELIAELAEAYRFDVQEMKQIGRSLADATPGIRLLIAVSATLPRRSLHVGKR